MKVFIDLDGTLTDGKMYIDHKGEKLFKAFHSRDIRAIRELIYHGYEVFIVSADDHESGKHFAEKVGAEFIYERDKSKLGKSDIAIGDDVFDRAMLVNATQKFCPADADPEIRFAIPGIVTLKTEGGKGVIADLVRHILKSNAVPLPYPVNGTE